MPKEHNYILHLQNQYSTKTFKRKQNYIKYNFGKYIPNNENLKVLEIGPGMGEFIDFLNKKNINDITIIDNDQSILDYNNEKFSVKKVLLLNKDIYELKNELQTYDLIYLTQVLEHVPLNGQKELITYLYSLLNDKGIIIITVPNANNFMSITELYGDMTHVNMFTSNSLMQFSQSIGINRENIHLQGFKIPPYEFINVPRIILQKVLHFIILCMYIANGGIYGKILTPNISLILKK